MGCNIKFMIDNYIDADTVNSFTQSSQSASYPASHIQDSFRGKVWRSNFYFLIDFSNNSLVINDGGDKTISLTNGVYSATTLATEIQTKLNAASSNFTVSYSATTQKFTISRTTNFSIVWTDNLSTCYGTLGFDNTSDSTGTDTYSGDYRRINWPAEWFKFDIGASVNPGAIILIDDIEEGIEIQESIDPIIQANISDTWNISEDIAIPYSANNITKINPDGLFTKEYRFFRLWIPDNDNLRGYLQLGRLYIGDCLELQTANVQRDLEEEPEDLSNTEESIGGEEYSDIKRSRNKFSNILIEYCNKSDRDIIERVYQQNKTHTSFFVSIDSEATVTDNVNEWTKYVKLTNAPKFQTVAPNIWNCRLSIREVI